MKKKIKTLGMMILAGVLFITGCGKSNNAVKEVDAVNGVSFEIGASILENATAITNISENSDYDKSTIYTYKDGADHFLLFQMSSMVVIAKRGTNYHFGEVEDKKKALEENAFLDTVWLEADGKSFEPSEHDKKGFHVTEGNVKAQIVITQSLYDDFTGFFKTIEGEDTEWSIFVGSPSATYENLTGDNISMMEEIVDSFKIREENNETPSTEKVVIGDGEKDNAIDLETEYATESVTAEQESEETESDEKKETLSLSNQNYNVLNHTIYNMAEIGDTMMPRVISYKESEIVTPTVIIDEVLTGKNAENLVKKYFGKGNEIGEYKKPTDGCSYHVAKYHMNYEFCIERPYINFSLCGMDGEALKFRGIKYSKKTYDIFTWEKEENKEVSELYIYYEVPNGLTEYALQVGDYGVRDVGEMESTAEYFRYQKN